MKNPNSPPSQHSASSQPDSWFAYLKAGLKRSLQPDPIAETGNTPSLKDAWGLLTPFMKAHWQSGVMAAVLIILVSLLGFPGPLINRFAIDDVILARRMDLLPWAIFLWVGLKGFPMAGGFLQNYYLTNFQQRVLLGVQKALLDHTLRLPKAFFDKKEIGYLVSRVSSDLHGLNWFFSGIVVYLITNLIRLVGGVGLLFYLEWRLASISVVLLPLMVLAVQYFSGRMRALSHQGMEQGARTMQHLQEAIASIPLIKAFATEARESQRVIDAYEAQRQLSMESAVVNSFASLVIQAAPNLARAVAFIGGAYLAIRGEWTLGSLLAFESYLGYVYGPATFLANTNLSLQNALASLERVRALFNIVPEDNLESGLRVSRIQGEIAFKDVSFSYGGGEPVLKEISFTIQPGARVAIVGPSGVGKTTLISLILCFYQPTQGQIRFDGRPMADYHLPSLRRRIGYVSQSTLLLSGSFRDNLCYGHPDASQAEIEAASRAAGIHEFITSQPGGYAARIDERGVNLSEGQKQRLSIARALIKSPDVLILDEPTAALDSIVERSIFASLPRLIQGKTLFVVAHRLATIQDSDLILLLNENRLVAMGTHQELLRQEGLYQQLISNQMIGAG